MLRCKQRAADDAWKRAFPIRCDPTKPVAPVTSVILRHDNISLRHTWLELSSDRRSEAGAGAHRRSSGCVAPCRQTQSAGVRKRFPRTANISCNNSRCAGGQPLAKTIRNSFAWSEHLKMPPWRKRILRNLIMLFHDGSGTTDSTLPVLPIENPGLGIKHHFAERRCDHVQPPVMHESAPRWCGVHLLQQKFVEHDRASGREFSTTALPKSGYTRVLDTPRSRSEPST